MPTTPNLLLTHVEEGQQSREVTINEALDGLDGALAGHDGSNFDFPSDANYWPPYAVSRASLSFEVVSTFGSLTATRDLIVAPTSKLYIIFNSTTGGQAITVKTPSGSGVTIANGERRIVFCDGTDVIASGPFDIGFFVPGVAPTSSLIWKHVFVRPAVFPDEFAGSEGHLETAPSSSITLDIQKNSVSVGSLVFTTAIGVFSTSGGGTTFGIGDTLELHTPANMQNAADLGFTFLGARA
ncbi:hypothetical protein LCGC14_1932410 [marine sediment metagenome]|uniref:Uncharacterized protein n=1 Tax=marine sediment metagenome TaxID=412755 RepID=A0A0F9IK77_9ZZZZ